MNRQPIVRSLGTTPISGKTLSEWKGHSRNTKFHSRNGIPRLEQYENHNSRSNSRSDSRNWWEPTWKIFILPHPVLPFLVFFWKKARKSAEKTRIFYPCQSPKIPGKEGKKLKKTRKSLKRGKKQGIPKKQGKEGQGRFSERFFRELLHAPSSGLFFATDLAISVRLASVRSV